MERSSIGKKIQRTRIRDYTFTIAFFFVTSFFVVFVIRPNLTVAFSLQEELETLRELNHQYEVYIDKVNDLNASQRANRRRLYVLDEAVPNKANINEVIATIRSVADDTDVVLNAIHVDEMQLAYNPQRQQQSAVREASASANAVKKYVITLDASATFDDAREFSLLLMQERRLKAINKLVFSRDEQRGTESAGLKLAIEIEQYYL